MANSQNPVRPNGRTENKTGPTTEAGRRKLEDKLKEKEAKEQHRKQRNKKKNQRKKDRQEPKPHTSQFERIFFEFQEKEKEQRRKQRKQQAKNRANKKPGDDYRHREPDNHKQIDIETCHNYRSITGAFVEMLEQACSNRKKEYLKLSLMYHPDKHLDNIHHYTEVFKCLQHAYEQTCKQHRTN